MLNAPDPKLLNYLGCHGAGGLAPPLIPAVKLFQVFSVCHHCMFLELPKVSGTVLAKIGDNVLFKCEYNGPQTIAWYKDKKKLDVKSKAKGKLMNKRRGKQHLNLPLTNITSNSTGIYGCGVVFDNSTFLTTIKLELFGKSDFTTSTI